MIYFKAFVVLLIIYILYQVLYSGYSLVKAMSLTKQVYVGDVALGKGSDFLMFVAGDSIGAGVGAGLFEKSVVGRVAGKIGENYAIHLTNKSVSGYKMHDVLGITPPNAKQDLILLIVGSNNLFHFTNLDDFRSDTREVLKKFSAHGKKVVIIGPGRVFEAGAIPFFLRPIYKIQGPKYAQIMMEESEKFSNVEYINPLATEISHSRYGETSASDHFHPNDEGHRFWFDLINAKL